MGTHDFIAQIQNKVGSLLAEFAEGKISREQFQAIYTHYSSQLTMANEALQAGTQVQGAQGETIAIRMAHMGKAIGLLIYHNKSGMLVETLGTVDVPTERIAPILNDFTLMMDGNKLIDRRVEKAGEKAWLLFAAGKYTTVVTLFRNEPSPFQMREIERLHHDFETANARLLAGARVESARLAYPFTVFVQQKLKGA